MEAMLQGEPTIFLNLIRTNPDWPLAMAPIIFGVVFFPHGAQKMLGWFGGYGFKNTLQYFTSQVKLPAVVTFLVIMIEFFASIGLILGLFSRTAALGVIALMIGAVIKAHLPHGLFMNWAGNQKGEGFKYHLLAMALALIIVAKGSGALSLDYTWYEHQADAEAPTSQVVSEITHFLA
jgi:putative oxidoreductase